MWPANKFIRIKYIMSSDFIRAGVIGAGLRGATYYQNLPDELKGRVQLVAIADPNEKHRAAFDELFGQGNARHYESGQELLQREELDALVIASPNHAHTRDALLAMEKRIPLMLEKPVAVSLEECAQLWRAWNENERPPVTVGFVLRDTPFYRRAHALLQDGVLGQLLSLDADENIGPPLTKFMRGGWRRESKMSGGFLIEKCSHDFDILRWLCDSEAARVFSIARITHFQKANALRHERFDAPQNRDVALDFSDARTRALFDTTSTQSLYEIGGDLPDHQSVMIEWENGVLSNFTATFAQPRTTRRLRVCGSDGSLEGDIGRSVLAVEKPGDREVDVTREEIHIEHSADGHHGGDAKLAAHFWNSCLTRECSGGAGLREGIEAAIIALAAQQSSTLGAPVEVAPLRHRVFDNNHYEN
jgi:predicted dehydrogenase